MEQRGAAAERSPVLQRQRLLWNVKQEGNISGAIKSDLKWLNLLRTETQRNRRRRRPDSERQRGNKAGRRRSATTSGEGASMPSVLEMTSRAPNKGLKLLHSRKGDKCQKWKSPDVLL